jgi:hypothetical protein
MPPYGLSSAAEIVRLGRDEDSTSRDRLVGRLA